MRRRTRRAAQLVTTVSALLVATTFPRASAVTKDRPGTSDCSKLRKVPQQSVQKLARLPTAGDFSAVSAPKEQGMDVALTMGASGSTAQRGRQNETTIINGLCSSLILR